VLAALVKRGVTGEGASLEVSLLAALAEWMGYPLTFTEATGEQQPRSGISHPAVAPTTPYPTVDGPDVLISVQNDTEWVRPGHRRAGPARPGGPPALRHQRGPLCEPDRGRPGRRGRHRELTSDEAAARLDAAGAPTAG